MVLVTYPRSGGEMVIPPAQGVYDNFDRPGYPAAIYTTEVKR